MVLSFVYHLRMLAATSHVFCVSQQFSHSHHGHSSQLPITALRGMCLQTCSQWCAATASSVTEQQAHLAVCARGNVALLAKQLARK